MQNYSPLPTTCAICDMTYAPDYEPDNRLHKHGCRQFIKATDRIQYTPLGFRDREDLKSRMGSNYHRAVTTHEKAKCAEAVIRCDYDRDLRDAIGDNSYLRFPSFSKYLLKTLGRYSYDDDDLKKYLIKKHTTRDQ